MSRKINVRSPFYLFIDDTNLNNTGTTTTTTTSTTTAAPVAGSTFSCPTFTGGGIAQNGTITDPTPSGGTIVGKSESYQGALITSVAPNNGINNYNKTLYFKILVPTNSNYTNSAGYIWCPVQFSQTTTTSTTTASSNQAPTWSCTTGQLTGGSISGSGTVYYPQVTGGSITGFALSPNGTIIQNVTPNSSSTNTQTITIYFKILVDSNYYNAGSTFWCPKPLIQGVSSSATTQPPATTLHPYNYYFVRGCSGTNYASNDMVIRSLSSYTFNGLETSGAAVFNIYGSCWYIYNTATMNDYTTNAGDLNSTTVSSSPSGSCIQCTGPSSTTSSSTTTAYTEFYLSAGRNALSDFCNTGSSVQNIVSVTGTGRTYANSLNNYVYTINGGNATIFNGSNKWFLVYNSPMNYAGTGSFNYWEITPQGYIVSSGVYSSCTATTSSGGGGQIGNEY